MLGYLLQHPVRRMISVVPSNSLLWFLVIRSCMIVLYLLEVHCIGISMM